MLPCLKSRSGRHLHSSELTKSSPKLPNLSRQIRSCGAHEQRLHKHTVFAPMPDRWSSTSAWGSNSVWGNRIHILTGSRAQRAGGARSYRGPTAAVLYFWTSAPQLHPDLIPQHKQMPSTERSMQYSLLNTFFRLYICKLLGKLLHV